MRERLHAWWCLALERLRALEPAQRTVAAIGLVIVLFVSLNILAGATLTRLRLDLTEDRLFTLSAGTHATLAAIDEPVDLRFYYTSELDQAGPYFQQHAKRIDELLEAYAELSDGMLRIERLDPRPFSPEEDLAVAEGLQPLPTGTEGAAAYFGLSGRNSTDDLEVIRYLAPERSDLLEYDLTRLVYDLAHPEKPVVAVLGDLPLMGSPETGWQPWLVLDAMQQVFEVRFLGGTEVRIEDDVDVLMLAQPQKLDDASLYAIDQYVMRGGPVLAFLDPYAEAMAERVNPFAGSANPISTLDPLLVNWGVIMPADRIVGDFGSAQRVQATVRGRPAVVPYLPWLLLAEERLAPDEPVTAQLERIIMASSAWIEPAEGAGTTLVPLISSTPDAMSYDVTVLHGPPEPAALLQQFEPAGHPFILAARVSGPVGSAFPDGPPAGVDAGWAGEHRSEAAAPVNLILVADSDLLADEAWVREQAVAGQSVTLPVAHNADFAVNALEFLTGSEALIGLRGEGLSPRPFEVIERMQREAERRYRAKEEELLAGIDAAQERIRALQSDGADTGVLLSSEQQAELEEFRTEMIRLRQDLRLVQRSLREDVEEVAFWVRVVNIWAVPVLIGLGALGLALWRRGRARRTPVSA